MTLGVFLRICLRSLETTVDIHMTEIILLKIPLKVLETMATMWICLSLDSSMYKVVGLKFWLVSPSAFESWTPGDYDFANSKH